MSMLADAQARERALDPATSFIVQAPAGSGKTELLTQRALVLLATVDEPEEVVAITFTRKAAAEMRHRLLDALRAAQGPAPEAEHARRSHTLAQAVLQRDAARGWQLLDQPERLRLLTYDALAAMLVRQSPALSGLSPGHRIADQAQQLYESAARASLQHADQDSPFGIAVRETLAHFDGSAARVIQQLSLMLARRDQWLPLVAEADARPPRQRLEGLLQELRKATYSELHTQLSVAQRQELLELGHYAYAQRLRLTPDKLPPRLRAESINELDQHTDNWLFLCDLLLTQAGTWRTDRGLNKSCGFPTAKDGPPEAAERKQQMQNLLAELRSDDALLQTMQRVRELPNAHYEEQQWQRLQALLDCLRLAAAELQVVCARRGEVDFIEIAARACSALGEGDAPSELALKLDYRIRHLLLDEFQDTSLPQFQLVSRLLSGWTAEDARTVFAVGDPMQSIYRFRQADVRLFLRAWTHGIGPIPLQQLRLSSNFRSVPGVVDWVNRAFDGQQGGAFPTQDDPIAGASRYTPSVAVRPARQESAVEVHGFADPQSEARRLAQLIQQALAEDPQQSIAVLVRARSHLQAVMPALQSAAIEFQAVELDQLLDWPVIRDLRALTAALAHPLDRLAWLAVLRAPWAGLQLADLLQVASRVAPQESIGDWLRAGDFSCLSAEGQQIAEHLQRQLIPSLDSRGEQPFAHLLEACWLALGGAQAAPNCAHAVRDYLSLLAAHTPAGDLEDFHAFDQALALRKISTAASASCRVQLLTMHKSKGLQFDTVLLPGLARTARSGEAPAVIWTQLPSEQADNGSETLIAPIHATGDEKDRIYDFAWRVERDRERLEQARLLYVAATRARNRLHLLCVLPLDDTGAFKPAPASSLLQLIQASLPELRNTDTAAEVDDFFEPPLLRRLPPQRAAQPWPDAGSKHSQALPTDQDSSENDGIGDHCAQVIGSLFHSCAQALIEHPQLRPAPEALVAQLQDELRTSGLSPEERVTASQRLQQGLEHLLDSERGRWVLQPHLQGGAEIELGGLLQDAAVERIVDRSFVDEQGTRWIIDYKTSVRSGPADSALAAEIERYRPQLENYAALYAAMESRPIRCALYFPMMGHWHDWLPAP